MTCGRPRAASSGVSPLRRQPTPSPAAAPGGACLGLSVRAPPLRRSFPCVPRRTAGAAGESRCSCLPPDRSRRRTTRRPRGSARRPSRRATARRAEDLLQLRAVHVDDLRRGRILRHRQTGTTSTGHLPGRRGIPSGLQWSKAPRSCKGPARAVPAGVRPAVPPAASRPPRRSASGRRPRARPPVDARPAAELRRRPPRPPGEAALGEPLVAEPEPLAVVHEQLQRRRLAIAEDEYGAGERVVLEGLLAEPSRPSILGENRPARRPPGSSSGA